MKFKRIGLAFLLVTGGLAMIAGTASATPADCSDKHVSAHWHGGTHIDGCVNGSPGTPSPEPQPTAEASDDGVSVGV